MGSSSFNATTPHRRKVTTVTGPEGQEGFSPYIDGTTKNWFTKTGDTGVSAEFGAGPEGPVGPKGDKGDQGIQGNAGPEGPQGPTGNAGIVVSSTAPSNPSVDDLWLDIS